MEKRDRRIEVGDIVLFNSGDPQMKVIGVGPRGKVWCEWEVSAGKYDDLSFPPECLIRARFTLL